jgi:transposase
MEEGMYGMPKTSIVRQRYKEGASMRQIAKEEGIAWRTVKKLLTEDDFSPKPPIKTVGPSKLDPFKHIIDEIMESDRQEWHKQRHTAVRIHERLVDEHKFDGSYSIVRVYVAGKRREMSDNIKDQYLDLIWDPGYAQIDFGEADFYEDGIKERKSFLVSAFPHSNMGFTQVFDGESAECLCQGLKDVFEFIGGVPHTMIFDNTTAVGRRVAGQIKESELFMRFRLHFGFDFRLTNPDSGHEKGTVEAKVSWIRNNMFVPIPRFTDIVKYNQSLLDKSLEQGEKTHYRKDIPVGDLFEADRKSLLRLPFRPFDVVRFEPYKTNKYGNITVDSRHTYSTAPSLARQMVTVAFRATSVTIYDDAGQKITSHRRAYGSTKTESIDHIKALSTLINKPGAWEQSGFRRAIDTPVRDYLDSQPKEVLIDYLRCMREQTKDRSLDLITDAMGYLVRRGGRFTTNDVRVMLQRIEGFGIALEIEPDQSLTFYDTVLMGCAR